MNLGSNNVGIADKTKYQVILKLISGEPLTSKRSWLSKENAIKYLEESLDQGLFEWGTLVKLDINDSLIDVEEFYAQKGQAQ